MMRYFGKVFFPELDRDQQRRRLNLLMFLAVMSLFYAAVVAAGVWLLNLISEIKKRSLCGKGCGHRD